MDAINIKKHQKPKFNLYKLIHKYTRSQICTIMRLAGNVDFHDANERSNFIERFKSLIDFLDDHSYREENYIHPLLKEIKSQHLQLIERNHSELNLITSNLKKILCEADARFDSYNFYLDFTQFQALYFSHLIEEERILMPELNKHFNDEKLMRVSGQIFSSMPIDVMVEITKNMLLVINHQERAVLFSDMKEAMPVGQFKAMCGLACEVLDKTQSDKLFNAIGLNEYYLSEDLAEKQNIFA